jgi:hypothetical protein
MRSMDGSRLQVLTDGVVTLRPPGPGDAERLVEGRDDEFRLGFAEKGKHERGLLFTRQVL